MLQSTGSQRVGHNLATEQQQKNHFFRWCSHHCVFGTIRVCALVLRFNSFVLSALHVLWVQTTKVKWACLEQVRLLSTSSLMSLLPLPPLLLQEKLGSAMDYLCDPPKTCWGSYPLYLRTWPCWDSGSLQRGSKENEAWQAPCRAPKEARRNPWSSPRSKPRRWTR